MTAEILRNPTALKLNKHGNGHGQSGLRPRDIKLAYQNV